MTPGEFYRLAEGFVRRERRLLEKVALIVSYLGQFRRPVTPKELLEKWLGPAAAPATAPPSPPTTPPDLSAPLPADDRAAREEKFARLMAMLRWKRARRTVPAMTDD